MSHLPVIDVEPALAPGGPGLRIGLGQILVEPGDVEANLARAGGAVQQAAHAGCDVVVLPECLDYGWMYTPDAPVDAIPGPISQRYQDLAREFGVYLAAGLTEAGDDGVLYNAAVLCGPDGDILAHHRKIHELQIARAVYGTGTSLGVVHTPVGVLGLDICADNSPDSVELGLALDRMGADIILSPCAWAVPPDHSNVSEPYGGLWEQSYAQIARRRGSYVVGVSNVGPVVRGPWSGWRCIGSSLVVGSPAGLVLARGPYDAEALLVVTVPRPGTPR